MVHKSYLKCGISNKMDGTKDDASYEDFLGEGVAETMAILIIMTIILLHMRFRTTTGASFFADDENDSDFEGFYSHF